MDQASASPAACPCRKLTLGYIGGAARPILARPTSDQRSGRHGGSARPSAMTGACAPHCSIFDTISEENEDAARQTQPHCQDNPAGSTRLPSNCFRRGLATYLNPPSAT